MTIETNESGRIIAISWDGEADFSLMPAGMNAGNINDWVKDGDNYRYQPVEKMPDPIPSMEERLNDIEMALCELAEALADAE